MNPRVVSLSGPVKGFTWQILLESSFTIGRGTSNQIVLNESGISRRHCTIVNNKGTFLLTDLDSLNGTFLNGRPVKEQVLNHGDRIDIGDFSFVFLLEEEDTGPIAIAAAGEFNEASIGKSTTSIRREDLVYLKPGTIAGALPASRTAHDLGLLLTVSEEILSAKTSKELFERLLKTLRSFFQADHIAVFLKNDEEQFELICEDKTTGTDNIDANKAVLQAVSSQNAAYLSCEHVTDPKAAYQAHSILCAPLTARDQTVGVLYLDFVNPSIHLDEKHLQLVATIACFVSLAYESLERQGWLENENRRLNQEIRPLQGMIGESPRMVDLFRIVTRSAATDSTVLITGESGTGKELVAQAIHATSPRSAAPFVAINCATLTENLLESELFGHEKGAFTGAIAQVKGKLEVAHTGTVFLDEVAELTPSLQAKLLRVLQERQFERIGGRRPIHVDIRLIAATNHNLKDAVKNGDFREDFYYRLNVLHLTVPPLRERKEDIPLLASHFVRKCSAKFQRRVVGVSPEARAYLLHYDWPGNVRELENAIERAIVLGSTDQILAEDLPDSLLETVAPSGISSNHYHDAIQNAKRQIIQQALEQEGGNVAAAARLLGLQRTYLHRVMRNLQIKFEE